MYTTVRNKLRAEKVVSDLGRQKLKKPEDGLRDRLNEHGWLNQKTLIEAVHLYEKKTVRYSARATTSLK